MMVCDRCQQKGTNKEIEATTVVFRFGEKDGEEDMTRIGSWEQDLCEPCQKTMANKILELINSEIKKS